jgi:hypothetical protein
VGGTETGHYERKDPGLATDHFAGMKSGEFAQHTTTADDNDPGSHDIRIRMGMGITRKISKKKERWIVR